MTYTGDQLRDATKKLFVRYKSACESPIWTSDKYAAMPKIFAFPRGYPKKKAVLHGLFQFPGDTIPILGPIALEALIEIFSKCADMISGVKLGFQEQIDAGGGLYPGLKKWGMATFPPPTISLLQELNEDAERLMTVMIHECVHLVEGGEGYQRVGREIDAYSLAFLMRGTKKATPPKVVVDGFKDMSPTKRTSGNGVWFKWDEKNRAVTLGDTVVIKSW